MVKNTFKFTLAVFVLLGLNSVTLAETVATWVGGQGNNYWGNASNWDTGVVPTGEDATAILLQGTPETSNATRGHMEVGNVIIGGGSSTVTLDGFSENLTTYVPNVLIKTNGTFKVTGNNSNGIDANYTVDGGTLDFQTSNARKMNLRNSNSVLNSGTITAGELIVGAGASDGTTTLIQNAGTVKINNMGDTFLIGGTKLGEMTVKSGTLTAAGKLRIGGTTGSLAGTLNVDGGKVSVANDVTLGSSAAGTINMTGGTVVFGGTAYIANDGATGNLNISGGEMTVNGSSTVNSKTMSIQIGQNKTGTVTVSGGTLNTTNGIWFGYSTVSGAPSTMTVSGTGTINCGRVFQLSTNSVLNINGGVLNTSSLFQDSTNSTLNFTGGVLQSSTITTQGTLTQSGGTLVTGYNGAGGLAITGNYTQSADSTLKVVGKTTVSGTATLNGTIDLSALGSKYVGTYGETFAVITAGTLAGTPTYTNPTNWTYDAATGVAMYSGGTDAWFWRTGGSGNYSTGANWNVNGVQQTSGPTTSSVVNILDTGSNTVTYDYGVIQAASLTIGNGIGGTSGTATVSRSANLTIDKPLVINRGGTLNTSGASVNVDNGFVVNEGGVLTSSSVMWIRNNTNSTIKGTVNASGAIRVGAGTAATLTIEDGAIFNSSSVLYIATNGAGTVNQNGGAVNITGGSGIQVCWGGANGTYNLSNGTLNVSGTSLAYIGAGTGAGVMNVTGGTANFNSTFTYNSTDTSLVIGQAGETANELNIYAGGVNVSKNLYVNHGSLSIAKTAEDNLGTGILNLGGELFVRGGSTLNLSSGTIKGNQNLQVGFGGMGTFNMSGGTANLNRLLLGNYSTATPTMSVSGGTINLTEKLLLGYNSNAIATISGNAIVNTVGGIQMGESNAGFTSTLNVNGGTVNIGSAGITNPSGSYALNFDGGTLGTYDAQSWSSSLNAVLGAGGITFAPSKNASITWNGTLSGTGGVKVAGLGSLILEGTQTYSGVTKVSQGSTLVLNNANLASSDFQIENGGSVIGSGSVANMDITGGTLEVNLDKWLEDPNTAPITVAGTFTFDPDSSIAFITEDFLDLIGTKVNFLVADNLNLSELSSIFDFSQAGGSYYWLYGVDGGNKYWVQVNEAAVPEPSSWILLSMCVAGLFWLRRKH